MFLFSLQFKFHINLPQKFLFKTIVCLRLIIYHVFCVCELTITGICYVQVNNAGVMFGSLEFTEEGLEKNFVVNSLGTYVLTDTLIPLLSKNENPRVVSLICF